MASSMASKLRGNVSLSEIDVLLLVREGELLATGDTTTELLSTCEKLDRDRDREDLRLLCRGSDGEPETPGVFGASIGVIDISVRGVDRALCLVLESQDFGTHIHVFIKMSCWNQI